MDSTDESYLLTGYEPKNYDLMATYVESFTESLTQPQDVDYDDTALEEMLHNAHRENMPIIHSEKACLLVSRRRPCPKERGDPLESEQVDLLDQVVRS